MVDNRAYRLEHPASAVKNGLVADDHRAHDVQRRRNKELARHGSRALPPVCGSESASAEAESFALADALAVAPVLALSCTRRTSGLPQTFMLLHQGLR